MQVLKSVLVIDVSKDTLDCQIGLLRNDLKEELGKPFKVKNSIDGFKELEELLRQLTRERQQMLIETRTEWFRKYYEIKAIRNGFEMKELIKTLISIQNNVSLQQ